MQTNMQGLMKTKRKGTGCYERFGVEEVPTDLAEALFANFEPGRGEGGEADTISKVSSFRILRKAATAAALAGERVGDKE